MEMIDTTGRLVAALVCGSALWLLGAREARALEPPKAAEAIALEVHVDPQISGADDLVTWANEEGRTALSELPPGGRRGSLRVAIRGSLYDYEVALTAQRENEPVGQSSSWSCECSNDELLARLRKEITQAADRLVDPTPAPAPAPQASSQDDAIEVDLGERSRARLGAAGGVGVALMTAGVAGVGAGVTLMAMNLGPLRGAGEWLDRRHFFNAGAYAAIGGAGLLLTGVTLYALRKRGGPRRRVELEGLTTSIRTDGQRGLVFMGRF